MNLAKSEAVAQQEFEPVETVHVLLIEDNPIDAKWVAHSLNRAAPDRFDLCMLAAADGVSEYLDRNSVDVIVLDLNLPDSNGWRTVTQITNSRPGMPIVVLSGQGDFETMREALLAGAQTYQVKSESAQDNLAERIDFAIRRKAREVELARRHFGLRPKLQEVASSD